MSNRADCESMTARVDGDRVIIETPVWVFTMAIGATYLPRRQVGNRALGPVHILGVAHADPERPLAPRLLVQRNDSKSPVPRPVWAASVVRTYDVPRVEKKAKGRKAAIAETNSLRAQVEDLRRELAALRALIKH